MGHENMKQKCDVLVIDTSHGSSIC